MDVERSLFAQCLEVDVHVLRAQGSPPPAPISVHGKAQLVGVLVEHRAGLSGRLEFRVRVVVVGAVEAQRRDRAVEIDRGLCIVRILFHVDERFLFSGDPVVGLVATP